MEPLLLFYFWKNLGENHLQSFGLEYLNIPIHEPICRISVISFPSEASKEKKRCRVYVIKVKLTLNFLSPPSAAILVFA